jgi:hypothetical protein
MMISYLVLILVAGLILYAVVEAGAGKKRGRGRRGPRMAAVSYRGHVDQADIRTRWSTIMATSNTGASGLKSSINEADKLLDHAMKQLGYPGERMGDRLKLAGAQLSDRDAVWRAHKLRNALAHEVGFDLVPSQAKEALRDFEQGLRDLGAL